MRKTATRSTRSWRIAKVFKEVGEKIASYLIMTLQNPLDSLIHPLIREIVYVTPLFEKGGKDKSGNYKSISLPSVPEELLESIMRERITKHFDKYELAERANIDF